MRTNLCLSLWAWASHYNQLAQTSVVFNGGYHQMMYHNNLPHQTQLFNILLHYCVHLHPNPHYNWLNQISVLFFGDFFQLVHHNHWQQHNQFLIFFLITVATSIKIQLFGESILRDQDYSFWGEIRILTITFLRGTNPDSQITQPFFKGFLLETLWWVQLERDAPVFSCDNNTMNIFLIGWYITILGLHA